MTKVSCCLVFLTIIISPLGLLCLEPKIEDREIIINLLLYLLLTPLFGSIHAFYLMEITLCNSISNSLLPPLGVFLGTKSCCKTLLCLLLTLLGFLPGIIYAHYQSINYNTVDDDKEIELDPENRFYS